MPKSRVRDTGVRRTIDHAVDPVFYIDCTFDFTDSSSIDFGVQLTEVSNRSVSSNVQLDNWGGLTFYLYLREERSVGRKEGT